MYVLTHKQDVTTSPQNKIVRKYPRPRDVCESCREEIVNCWGEQMSPYWRHLTKSTTSCQSAGESATHRLAKRLLMDYLKTNGCIKASRYCKCCKQLIVMNEICATGYQVYCEKKEECFPYVWDVLLKKEENFLCGIEVYVNHRADRPNFMLPWIEVDAMAIINLLDRESPSNICEITDIRDETCDFCQTKSLRKDEYNRMSMAELAQEMGYLEYEPYVYENDCIRVHEAAIHGKYRSHEEFWETHSKKTISSDLWEAFLDRKTCLYCEGDNCHERWYPKRNYPYCINCYNEIKTGKCDIVEFTFISDDQKRFLRAKLSWLNNLPSGDSLSECSICGIYSENVIQGFWWFGKKKRCCATCLEKKLIENGVLNSEGEMLISN